jgi:hypothetical protein
MLQQYAQVAVAKHAPIPFTLQSCSHMMHGQSLEQIAQRNRQQQLAGRRKLNVRRQSRSAQATDHTQRNARQQPGHLQPKQHRIASWGGSQHAPQQRKHWHERPAQQQHNWQQRQYKKQKLFNSYNNISSSSHIRPGSSINRSTAGKRVPFMRGRASVAALSTHMGSLNMKSAGWGRKAHTTGAHQKQQQQQQQQLSVHGSVRKAYAATKKQQRQKRQQQRPAGGAVPGKVGRRTG